MSRTEMEKSPPRPPSLIFQALEARLSALDLLPRGFWLSGITHSRGRLDGRLEALSIWREALLHGRLPVEAPTDGLGANDLVAGRIRHATSDAKANATDDATPTGIANATPSASPGACPGAASKGSIDWPDPGIVGPLRERIARLGLPAYAADRDAVADTIVQSLLFHLDLIVDYIDRGDAEQVAIARALDAFEADWQVRCGDIDALIEIFGDPGDLLKNCRWDMLRGLLRSENWQAVVQARASIAALPELAALIRRLGRAEVVDDPASEPVSDRSVSVPGSAPQAILKTITVPELPGETRGVRRSGRVARMLPSESMMFLHPRLRLVWHARHAERALLTYEDDDRLSEVRHVEAPVLLPGTRPAPRREMGPMLVCVDTSASMRGGAERVAKAIVLEAARVAHSQRRSCHVFAFGGPDEIVELDLSMDEGGLLQLSRFLGQGFQGGTDITGPLERVLDRLEDSGWRLADLLIASDGEFGATPALAERLHRARADTGLRVQAVLIGDRETIGLLEISDDIFWVRDWRRFGGSAGDSPVHASSLTASYFPGALRTAGNREATVSGAEVSRAMRVSGRARITDRDR